MKEQWNESTATAKGLYDPSFEHDNCGIGAVVNIKGIKTHQTVENALKIVENLKHRAGKDADGKTGDGVGILLQISHKFFKKAVEPLGIKLGEERDYGVGMFFFPQDELKTNQAKKMFEVIVEKEGMEFLGWREVPTFPNVLGHKAVECMPYIMQGFVKKPVDVEKGLPFDRRLYIARRVFEQSSDDTYVVSLSSRTIVYKGMFLVGQLRTFFADLQSADYESAIAMVHSRFSTNTNPSWERAHPNRLMVHNGEINTIRGNADKMLAREENMESEHLKGQLHKVLPAISKTGSDSAMLDNTLEFLVMSGMELPLAVMIAIPEPWANNKAMSQTKRDFYQYYATMMEPWDGPASILFSDGDIMGAVLDRNGLRPSRYMITDDDTLILSSEVGVLECDPENILVKERLRPGKMLLVDTVKGEVVDDEKLKELYASREPYGEWIDRNLVQLSGLKIPNVKVESYTGEQLTRLQKVFGYKYEDVNTMILAMARAGAEPSGAMGTDTPLAVLSSQHPPLFNYFKQRFAQVTNPAIDPIREQLVMSLTEYIGAVGMNILLPSESHCKMVRLPHPVLTNTQLDILCNIRYKGFNTVKLPMLFDAAKGTAGLQEAIYELCRRAEASVDDGVNYIILTDEGVDRDHVAIPSLLAVSAVHHHLISVQKRVQTALIVKSGEIREVMHAALLLGYGASAINPYMAFAVLDDLVKRGDVQMNYETAESNYIKALCKGLYKIMSKMGISTIRSYRGAKIFETVGVSEELLRNYFGTQTSSIGGIRLKEIADSYTHFHDDGFSIKDEDEILPNIGQFSYRKDGERHAWNPETIALLQLATRQGNYNKFKEFTAAADHKAEPIFLRDFFTFKKNPIPIDEVEPVEEIVKHFVTGAMSFGAISKEAHEALALAMNRLGARSNTGEGGEDSSRFHEAVDGVSLSSKTKQIASGRFGVTTEYLVNAEEIQIKVAQGAKPGEGGQLPGFKVNEVIARTRHSIPGISLISPPPHHDIYSIEDLAQLIFDLKNVNPRAAISVKLVAESGVGTIAAGVAKAKADLIVISGAEGGTGASPASSMRYAGISPEIGLSETQQTLVRNGLRGKVRLQTDGQMKTGHDIVSMALLGAEEFGFGTTVLIVLGCVMMRKCHSNTCPMGVATQNPELRAHFRGHADHVVNYFRFLAEEVREYLAEMGFRKFNDIIGRTDLIEIDKAVSQKSELLDFSRLLHKESGDASIRHTEAQMHDIDSVLDRTIITASDPAISNGKEVSLEYTIANTDRAVGAMLSGLIADKFGNEGLPDESISVRFKGSAGQSFGAFLAHGISFKLEGEANDYLGKGLSGGRIAVAPPVRSHFAAEKNTIAGNTLLYGATSGEVYINGRVGERFAVRNSGAIAVVEGVGDHCCEYMTGGRVVVLGATGRNFAAGMSGGVAYVWDPDRKFDYFCNMEMVELSLIEDSSARKELHELIRQHYRYTGSALARQMLDEWNRYVDDFIQVTPIEYKRVLAEEQMLKLQQKIAEVQRDY